MHENKEISGKTEVTSDLNNRFGFWLWTLIISWTIIIISSVAWNIANEKNKIREYARIAANAAFTKDVLFRSWNASKGGLYAPVSKETPPNPYLKDYPNRDIITTDSLKLTLINPAYMTRQVHELGDKKFGILAHITSLKPIRPANKANDWETQALQQFENGVKEVSEIVEIDATRYLNFMKPLFIEKACLTCHAKQGYKLGDIRGGIRVSIPLAPYVAVTRIFLRNVIILHFLIWLLVLTGILLAAFRIRKTNQLLQHAGIKLQDSETRLRQMMQQSPIAIEIFDNKGVQIEVNDAYSRLWGIKAANTLNKFNLFNSNEMKRSGLAEYIDKAYLGEFVSVPEYEFDPVELSSEEKTGSKRWLNTKIYPLFNQDGSVKNVVLIHEDVTERKNYEKELLQHRTKLEELVKERTKEVELKNVELVKKNEELENYNNLFVGREFRIKELKNKIEALEEKIRILNTDTNG